MRNKLLISLTLIGAALPQYTMASESGQETSDEQAKRYETLCVQAYDNRDLFGFASNCEKAAKTSSVASAILGNAYLKGEMGVKPDKAKSYEHFRNAAQSGNEMALIMAGKMAMMGYGTEIDLDTSKTLLKAAAQKSNGKAAQLYSMVIALKSEKDMNENKLDDSEALNVFVEVCSLNEVAVKYGYTDGYAHYQEYYDQNTEYFGKEIMKKADKRCYEDMISWLIKYPSNV